jgi:hypothetical protein
MDLVQLLLRTYRDRDGLQGVAERTSPLSFTFSSSFNQKSLLGHRRRIVELRGGLTLYGAYHFASRVLPLVILVSF